ncbi:MAG: hypothetical protein JWR75_1481 [Devosia sp.]|nr:hypothetical protein [Devosia sp.]
MRLIKYTTKPGRATENRELIAKVFAGFEELQLPDLQYAVLETAEGDFLHLVETTAEGSKALQASPAFRAFTANLEDRQTAPLTISELKVVGNYGGLIDQ